MSRLNTAPNLQSHDDLYQALVDFHDGLSEVDSLKVNAKLIVLLANHIGDEDVVLEAITVARKNTEVA